jgi:hypothetical protein
MLQPHRRNATLDPANANALAWLERASLPIQQLQDPRVIREVLDALAYAAELGLLPANPLTQVGWKVPAANAAANPLTVASPAQAHTILAEVSKIRPELSAFFACLYYAAVRPEEAVALRGRDLVLPSMGGKADPHQGLPAHWICLDQHRDALPAARSQAPPRAARSGPSPSHRS